MKMALKIGRRLPIGAFALLCGIFTGTALAVAVVAGGPKAWIKSYWIFVPLKPGEADGTWLLEAEWRIAFAYACLIALVASILWGLAAWRGISGWKAALLLGFVLSGLAASIALGDGGQSVSSLSMRCFLIACAGALAGAVTFSVDKSLTAKMHPRLDKGIEP